MKFIAHRGNLNGRQPARENSPDYVMQALGKGFECEIDVWYNGKWWLGHDTYTHLVTADFLCMPGLWCHAKDAKTYAECMRCFGFGEDAKVNYFYHTDEDVVVTSRGYFWTCEQVILHHFFKSVWMNVNSYPSPPENRRNIFCSYICTDYATEWNAQWYTPFGGTNSLHGGQMR